MKTKKGQDERRPAEATSKQKQKQAVVLRMALHCDGCALKVRKALKGAQGAASVTTDVAAGTVTVAGGADPWDLRDRIHARIKPALHVAFVSPPNPPRPPPKQQGRHDKQMPPPPPESTVALNVQLHCKGCTDRIKRKASKIKGVKQVTVDTAKEQVTVKGTMDAKALPDVLSAKLRRPVTAVPVQPMANKNKDKKAAAAGGRQNHDDNREQGEEDADGSGGARKKNKQRGGASDDHNDEMASSSWMSEEQQLQLQYPMTIFPASYGRGGSVGSSYRVELLQGPQPFSDENPNACSLM